MTAPDSGGARTQSGLGCSTGRSQCAAHARPAETDCQRRARQKNENWFWSRKQEKEPADARVSPVESTGFQFSVMFKWRVVRESEAGSGGLAATTEDPLATVAAYYDSKYQDNFQTTRLDNFINVNTLCRCINCCTLANVTCLYM